MVETPRISFDRLVAKLLSLPVSKFDIFEISPKRDFIRRVYYHDKRTGISVWFGWNASPHNITISNSEVEISDEELDGYSNNRYCSLSKKLAKKGDAYMQRESDKYFEKAYREGEKNRREKARRKNRAIAKLERFLD